MNRKFLITAGAVLILSFAAAVRLPTFWLPHAQGEEGRFVCLAMKLDKEGLSGYNFSRIKIEQVQFPDRPGFLFFYPKWTSGDFEGDLARSYHRSGMDFYNTPLYFQAPLFASALAASHHFFAELNQPFIVRDSLPGEIKARLALDRFIFKTQFWASIVPFVCSLALIAVTLFFGMRLFGARAGLLAGFFLASNPADILASCRILSDPMAALFLTAAFWVFYEALENESPWASFGAGALMGFAVLTQQEMLIALPVFWFYSFMSVSREAGKNIFLRIGNRYFISFVIGILFISLHWFWKVYQVHGTPFFAPRIEDRIFFDLLGEGSLAGKRPHGLILFTLGSLAIGPVLIFALGALKSLWREITDILEERRTKGIFIGIWAWLLIFIVFFSFRYDSADYRYLLPAYPAFCLLAGFFADRIFSKKSRNIAASIWGAVFLSVVWSLNLSAQAVFSPGSILSKPF